jgi:hypothetical protein
VAKWPLCPAVAGTTAMFLSTVWYRFCPPNQSWNFGKHADFAVIVIYLTYSCREFDDVPWLTGSIINYETVTDSEHCSAVKKVLFSYKDTKYNKENALAKREWNFGKSITVLWK